MTTKEILKTSGIFILSILALTIPIIMLVHSATSNFTATATVTNLPPNLVVVDGGQTITGQAGGSKTVYLTFNASDPNGYSDLNDSTAKIIINKSGESARTSSSCAVLSHPNAQSTRYNCSITFWYFDASGTWSVNASIDDNSSNFVQNYSSAATVNSLDAVSAVSSSIAFSGAPGTNDNAGSPLQQLNNTGNINYGAINITGFAFIGNGAVIAAGNISANTSNSGGIGQQLVNNTKVQLQNSALNKGNNSLTSIYFWMDVPSGVPSGSYSAQSSWILEAN